MDILTIGLGTIGTTYSYLFNKAGHNVEHYIRKSSKKINITELNVDMLDGRNNKKGDHYTDTYKVNTHTKDNYDFIFISMPAGNIESVIETLNSNNIKGTIILCCGIWEDKKYLEKIMQGREYILGYPVAGGNIVDTTLTCCIFDHFILEKKENSKIDNYYKLVELFESCNIKLETPYDMLEWIWLHMAINAGVVSIAAKYADMDNPTEAAENLMSSSKLLAEAVCAIRETSKIIKARGVNLKHYRNELWGYKLPIFVSAPIMKRMFATNILTRKIMTLHNNTEDLLFVCKCLYDTGKQYNIKAPIFYNAYEKAENKF